MFGWISEAAASLKTSFTDAVCPECPIVICPTLSEQLWSAASKLRASAQESIAQVPGYAYIVGSVVIAGIVYALHRLMRKTQKTKPGLFHMMKSPQ